MKMQQILIAGVMLLSSQFVGGQTRTFFQASAEEAQQMQKYLEHGLSKTILEPQEYYGDGPALKISIQIPSNWRNELWAHHTENYKRFGLYVADPKDNRFVDLLARTVKNANVPDAFFIRDYLESGYQGIEVVEWEEDKMNYTVEHPKEGVTRISLDLDIKKDDRKIKINITSVFNGEFVLVSCIGAPRKKMESVRDELLTIAESMRFIESSSFPWQDPRFSEPRKLASHGNQDPDLQAGSKRVVKSDRKIDASVQKSQRASQKTPEHGLPMKRHIIYDSQFGMEAARCLVPIGWNYEAEIVWDWQKMPPEAYPIIEIANPDRSLEFHRFPAQFFCYSDNPMLCQMYVQRGYDFQEIMEAVDFLNQIFFPTFLPSIKTYQLIKNTYLEEESNDLRASELNNNPNSFVYKYHIQVGYVFRGRSYVSDLVVAHYGILNQTPMGPYRIWSSMVTMVQSEQSRKAELSPLVPMIYDSFKQNKYWAKARKEFTEWYNYKAQQAAMAQTQVSTSSSMNRYQQISNTLSETRDIVMDGYNTRSASQSRIFSLQYETTTGTNTFYNHFKNDYEHIDSRYDYYISDGITSIPTNDPDNLPAHLFNGTPEILKRVE